MSDSAFIKGNALLIGVSQYRNVTALPQAVINDVNDISATLTDPRYCGYDPSRVQVLTDDKATRDNILRTLEGYAKKANSDEPFFFYFSGHGDRYLLKRKWTSCLLGIDADLDKLHESAVSDRELLECLTALPSKQQVIVLDACHAGGMGTLKQPSASTLTPKGIADSASKILSSGSGRVILTSCRSEEVSVIHAGARNSIFTDAILSGLKGKAKQKPDGMVGIFDLFEHVAADVTSRSDQHPIFKTDNLEGNFSIARSPREIAKTPTPGKAPPAVSSIVDMLAELFPLGPAQGEIWTRAGGDLSRLSIAGPGKAQWYAAIQTLRRGGGGTSERKLLETVLEEFPLNQALLNLLNR